jgi:hypothetical protein
MSSSVPIYEYLTALTKSSKTRHYADTDYARGQHPWFNNVNDREMYLREFETGYPERMRIAQAMLSANPMTPEKEIRQNMTVKGTPSRFGYSYTELTVTDVLDGDFDNTAPIKMFHVNDFSGSAGESNASSRPSIF